MRSKQLRAMSEVAGAASEELIAEDMPCGTGYAHRFLDADGNLLKQDYIVCAVGAAMGAQVWRSEFVELNVRWQQEYR